MRAQRLERPHNCVTRSPELEHQEINRRIEPSGAEINQIGEQLQYLDSDPA